MPDDLEGPRAPLVVAVVITWNDVEMTARCIESVLASDHRPLRVLLVDNGSATPCGEELRGRFPGIELLVLPENRGFSGGANRGLTWALEQGADYIHLIGNDSTLASDAISKMVMALEQRPAVGGASPLLLHAESEKRVQFYIGTIERNRARHIHHHENLPYQSREWPTAPSEFVPFVAVMFRRQALEEAGMFDESFSTCWEDYDLCIRFNDAGWPFITVGDAEVVHLGSVTTGRFSPYITYYSTRNRLICLFRYAHPLALLREAPFITRTFYRQMKRYGIRNWACHKAFVRGVVDFVLGVRGACKVPLARSG
jgi:GT2 family glycosyltransferase